MRFVDRAQYRECRWPKSFCIKAEVKAGLWMRSCIGIVHQLREVARTSETSSSVIQQATVGIWRQMDGMYSESCEIWME